jgi:hypothetical protein
MLNRLLSRTIDNTYRGHRLAIWILALVVLMKTIMSLNSIFNGYDVATTADGIPLDTYPPAAARTIVALFAIFGLAHFVLCLLCSLVLVRYRSLVPFMLALLLLEHLSRRLILYVMPVVRVGSPPGFVVNVILLVLMIVGLALSLRRTPEFQASATC